MKRLIWILSGCLVVVSISTRANNTVPWAAWVDGVRVEALAQGIHPRVFDQIFSTIPAPNPRVLHYDHHQPEKRLTFLEYRDTRVDAYRIRLGQQAFKQHQALLHVIGEQYGVDPCVIVALWGLETSYGKFVGVFPVIPSLATLAYDDSPRAHFFRAELLDALHIVNDGQIDYKNFKGEWAGASGQCQFLPSSWKKYAVDYDGDGRKDIWTTLPDVFASIANYLTQNGWHKNELWAVEVNIPASAESLQNLKISKTLAEWRAMGIKGVLLDQLNQKWTATLIHPDGGPHFLIFHNFNVLMKWNHSTYYVGAVGYAAERICKGGERDT